MDICVDFDGTCTTHSYPDIGVSIGAEEVLKELVQKGHRLILFTMRSGKELQEAVDWFQWNGIPLYGIQKNPTQSEWTSSPKAYGQKYIDDAAIGIPLIKGVYTRPYVDWKKVEELLIEEGIL